MDILIQTPIYNESQFLPFYLKYYDDLIKRLGDGKIILFDMGCTDNSIEIINEFKQTSHSEIRTYEFKSEFHHNQIFMLLRNHFYKTFNYSFDYVFIVDCDEILYSKNLVENILSKKYTIFKSKGINVSCEGVPDAKYTVDNIPELEFRYKFSWYYNKCNIFSPNDIEINYQASCHTCKPKGNVIYNNDNYLLHFKYLGYENFLKNSSGKANRVKNREFDDGTSWHYEEEMNTSEIEYQELYVNDFKKSGELFE